MKVLVLGGTGFVGRAVAKRLNEVRGVETTIGARNRVSTEGCKFESIDATSSQSLLDAISNVDVVVNCVTGSARTIRKNAVAIVDAASKVKKRVKISHMSSMAVYGGQQGVLDELAPVSEGLSWYGKAKIDAERILRQYAEVDGSSTIFRAGCIYGANSALWVDRIGLLLKNGLESAAPASIIFQRRIALDGTGISGISL
jgi:nucleoside-diphosphate-sugar epimerase